jgi:hypothetical protein
LAASASTPKAISSGERTGCGVISLLTASTTIKTAMPNKITALTMAARISARA